LRVFFTTKTLEGVVKVIIDSGLVITADELPHLFELFIKDTAIGKPNDRDWGYTYLAKSLTLTAVKLGQEINCL
jgi:hypothetical protein